MIVSGGLKYVFQGDLSHINNIGIGTIITAFMMGPLVNFFSKNVTSKILDVDYTQISKDVAFFMISGAMVKNRVPKDYNPAELNTSSDAFVVLNKLN